MMGPGRSTDIHVPIRLLLENSSFDPEEIAMLVAAFEDCLRALGLADRADGATEIVAREIIALAKQGERDPARLRDAALQSLRK